MPNISNLFHVAIRPTISTRQFVSTPRCWVRIRSRVRISAIRDLARRSGGAAIVHLYAGGRRSRQRREAYGAAAIDHVSITATGFHRFVAKFRGTAWTGATQRTDARLWQLFVSQSDEVHLEITFEAANKSNQSRT